MRKKKKKDKNSVCEKCGGTLFVFTENGPVPCECREEHLKRQRLKSARIPPRYVNKSISTFKGKDKKRRELRNDANLYVKQFSPESEGPYKKGFLYMGPTGCGKSHLATGILKAIIEKGYTGYYCNVVDFFAKLRDTYGGDTAYDEMDMIDRVNSVDFLVLDDLGAEKPSAWMRDRLYAVVNRRYESNLPILVTTNKTDVVELEEHVGKRIVSRLCEMCVIVDNFPDDDYRMMDLDEQMRRSIRKRR